MRLARWTDHLPPWLAYGAIVSTEIYEPWELTVMAAPLLFAALAEGRRWGLGPWRRAFEALAILCLVGLLWARVGLVPTTISMLFLLCGIRLCLPRELGQRRQVLLMSFLIWLTTAITTFEIDFLLWSVLWVASASLALMQQTWEDSSRLRGGPLQKAPYRRLPGWALGTVLISAAFFVILPRITFGFRAFPWGVAGLTSSRAGLSDLLELGETGPIAPNSEVVLRVLPPEGDRSRCESALALLRGITLETLDGQKWSPNVDTAHRPYSRLISTEDGFADWMLIDYYIAPSPHGILPFPYGQLALIPPRGMPILGGPGGSLRWMFPSRRPLPLRFLLEPSATLPEARPRNQRWQRLTHVGSGHQSADRWSRARIPEELPATELAERLSEALRSFEYTMDNPSGKAANPLQDFLENSRAGHCEYFASALALMLRHRGIPARIVNGYRLGPWIAEGGYWLVTQNEAHSWVEFYDVETKAWHIADPTPAAAPRGLETGTFWATFQRWTDAIRFRWDRHVVRFSSEDQMTGLDWVQSKVSALPRWRPGRTTGPSVLKLALVALVLWGAWRFHPWRWHRGSKRGGSEYSLKPLRPLLRAARRRLQPAPGETVRQWLLRVSYHLPERADALVEISDEADAVAYGGEEPQRLKALVKREAKAWRRSYR